MYVILYKINFINQSRNKLYKLLIKCLIIYKKLFSIIVYRFV